MRQRAVIEIVAENYDEEQFLLKKFPDAVWLKIDEETRFFVPSRNIKEVGRALREFKNLKGY